MPFVVSGHNLVIGSETALSSAMSPLGTQIGSIFSMIFQFFPVIVGVCALFLILNWIFSKLSN